MRLSERYYLTENSGYDFYSAHRSLVEEDAPVWWSWRGATRRGYRDANSMDLARPELAALLSLRVDPTGLRRDRLVPYVSGRPPAGSDREPISAGALTAAAAAR